MLQVTVINDSGNNHLSHHRLVVYYAVDPGCHAGSHVSGVLIGNAGLRLYGMVELLNKVWRGLHGGCAQ